MKPGQRSDPKKLAADRAAIRASMESPSVKLGRAEASRAKAVKDAEQFRQSGEGTLPEAFQNLLDTSAEKRRVKKYGGDPSREGATQVGFRPDNGTV